MDYLLENLGPERFQELCNALLAKAFPRTQCFPVGQADAGRDALLIYAADSEDFIVFQVKFARKPLAIKNPHRWLTAIVKAEAPKLQQLIPKGAKEYYLLTNVPGTAFPGSGSIDTVQRILAQHVDIPAHCWWRDDVNRRLDDAWDIKWSYPDILSGPDILRVIVEKGLEEDAERRTSAIRAFVRDQFERDTEVRFKQVELQNELLDLFIDVPVIVPEEPGSRRGLKGRQLVEMIAYQESRSDMLFTQKPLLGTATLMLNPTAQQKLTRVVIEGAPGQGKSTIVQYVCQIHRSRILNEYSGDDRIPEKHRNNPVRLPFKIDCRDFALWLDKKNPFSADDATDVPPGWVASLESFLSAHITHYSGGSPFSVADLHAVANLSALLLVFDGLDEVADLGRRREVVDEISKGLNRIQEVAVSVQSIVTSRPAAFEDSPGFPENTFTYLQLASINQELIEQYAEKWVNARRLEEREGFEIRQILSDKLDQPHFGDLARNPMQLAILLSLIQTRGRSLPDKRTALYDSYIELFFNREAEKSSVVRDHRDLLINIHRYVAWVLHSEAQTRGNRGSVNADRLQRLVETYLGDEGHDTSLAQRLFTGMVERVVALVSRVEGTYEFEVQPLREYFAARYLYDTAPYSPPGGERRGTLPERFDALARDFFWQNVTRFFAGCYSTGELASLVDRLEALAHAAEFRHTSHPQSLAATLLSDWVFAQQPKSVAKVVALVLDGTGLRKITSGGRQYSLNEPLKLPSQNGNDELVERCFELLLAKPSSDHSLMLLQLIRANTTPADACKRWLHETLSLTGSDRTRWITDGLRLGALGNLTNDQLGELLQDDYEVSNRLTSILIAGQEKFILEDEDRFDAVIQEIFEGNSAFRVPEGPSILYALGQVLGMYRYIPGLIDSRQVNLSSIRDYVFGLIDQPSIEPNEPSLASAVKCNEFVRLGQMLTQRSVKELATQIGPWDDLVEGGRRLFGDQWVFCRIANASAGIHSKHDTCDDASDLHDDGMALCRRARYARLRAGSSAWWQSILDSTNDEMDLGLTLLVFWTWAGPTVIQKLLPLANEKLETLTSDGWRRLSVAFQTDRFGFGSTRRRVTLEQHRMPDTLSERTVLMLSHRVGDALKEELFHRYIGTYEGDDRSVLQLCESVSLSATLRDPKTWPNWLPVIARAYAKGATSEPFLRVSFGRGASSIPLPIKIAKEIVENCDRYPTSLVGWAEHTCRQTVAQHITPVGTVAEADGWFS